MTATLKTALEYIREIDALQLRPDSQQIDVERFRARLDRLNALAGLVGYREREEVKAPDHYSSDLGMAQAVIARFKAAQPAAKPEQLAAMYRDWLAAVELIMPPRAPAAPAPVDVPGPVTAPQELSEAEATALLEIMRAELVRYGVQPTVAETNRVWRMFWRNEGRRWGRNTPGWGPEEGAADRPAVLEPWPLP